MILFSYILSTLSGFWLISLLFHDKRPFSFIFHLAFSIGIGLGLSALINFFLLLTFGAYNRLIFMSAHTLIPLILWCAYRYISKSKIKSFTFNQIKLDQISIVFTMTSCLFIFFMAFITNIHPFGEWDAWALWNMKLKFLLFSGNEWKSIFTSLHWSTQPDYPLLLPLMNMTPFVFLNTKLLSIPMTTAMTLTLTTGIVLFAGLKKCVSPLIGLLAYILLMSNAFFIYQATSQYSDVLLGLYLLMSFVALSCFENDLHPGYAGLLGIILGFMAFTKNEGIVMSGLIGILFIGQYLSSTTLTKSQKTKIIQYFIFSLAAASLLTIYFKIFLAPRNRDILVNLSYDHLKFFNLNGLMITFNGYTKELLHLHWSYLWIFCGILILLGIRNIFRPAYRIYSLFFLFFFIVLTLIYITTANFDLGWRLESTLARIFSYLLPSVLYYSFYLNNHSLKPTAKN